ncbi:hypothetical protein F5880DRAFT_1510786 [Lentinula raphanica]|nr:hypothetical protein F5880DRAFT_1510786 [Lentinula raphanica]
MPSFSPEQLQFLAGLPSELSSGVLEGQIPFHTVLMTALNTSSPPSTISPSSSTTSFTAASTASSTASGPQILSRRNQQITFTFPQAFMFLRVVRDEDPFSGSNAAKRATWEAVLKVFHGAGGDPSTGVDWIKKKVNEFIDYHESTKPQAAGDTRKNITNMVRKIMDVHENWTTLASCLDKISENRLKGRNESSEESAKRRQVESNKTAVGKAIVEASLKAFSLEFFPLENQSPADVNRSPTPNVVDSQLSDDDDIMVLDDSGVFLPFKPTTGEVKVKTEDVEMKTIYITKVQDVKQEVVEQENVKAGPSTSSPMLKSSRRKRTIDRSVDLLKDANDKFSRSLDLQERLIQSAENQNKILQDQHDNQMDFQRSLLSIFRDMANTNVWLGSGRVLLEPTRPETRPNPYPRPRVTGTRHHRVPGFLKAGWRRVTVGSPSGGGARASRASPKEGLGIWWLLQRLNNNGSSLMVGVCQLKVDVLEKMQYTQFRI